VRDGISDARCDLFEAAEFATLRDLLAGVDLTRAVYLDRGTQVTAYRAGTWVIRVPRTADGRTKVAQQTGVYRILAARGLPVPRDAGVSHGAGGEVTAGFYLRPGDSATTWSPGWRAISARSHRFAVPPAPSPLSVVSTISGRIASPRWGRSRGACRSRARLARGHRALRQLPERTSPQLCGTAISWRTVLVGPDGRLAGVIDPSGPWIADPALDFGTLAERFGSTFADDVLAAYTGPRDPGFTRRACFCANVRPLVTIEAGLRRQDDARLRLGLRRLAERMADTCEPR
jgi:hypothetical protein